MEDATKRCPYCGEMIKTTAIKCKYCGEWLAEKPSATPPSTSPTPEPDPDPITPPQAQPAAKEVTRPAPLGDDEYNIITSRPLMIILVLELVATIYPNMAALSNDFDSNQWIALFNCLATVGWAIYFARSKKMGRLEACIGTSIIWALCGLEFRYNEWVAIVLFILSFAINWAVITIVKNNKGKHAKGTQ